MAAITPDLGTGISIAFSTSFLAKLLDVQPFSLHRDAKNTSTMATTTAHTFMPADLYDPGELVVTMQFDTDATPPITSAAETITITFPDSETVIGSGFMTDYTPKASNEEVMTADVTIKWSGPLTF